MLYSLFGPISSFKAPRRMAGVFVGSSASTPTFMAVMLVMVGAGNSCVPLHQTTSIESSGCFGQAVKLRKCYQSSLDLTDAILRNAN